MAAIKQTRNYWPMSDQDINVTKQAKTLVHFYNNCLWTKKNNPEFNNSMTAFDSAKSCNIVGIRLMLRLRFLFDI